jgi:alkylhydroperoxidase family enzyme
MSESEPSDLSPRTDKDDVRFPTTAQTPEQSAGLAEAEKLVNQTYGSSFALKDANGNLLGPFGPLAFNINTLLPYLNYTQSTTQAGVITPKERELATLATVSVTGSDYIIYAHKKIGMSVGLTQKQVNDAAKGDVPNKLGSREQAVYVLALKLANDYGSISDRTFKNAVKDLGRNGTAQVAQMVGSYLLSSVLVNLADVEVPDS